MTTKLLPTRNTIDCSKTRMRTATLEILPVRGDDVPCVSGWRRTANYDDNQAGCLRLVCAAYFHNNKQQLSYEPKSIYIYIYTYTYMYIYNYNLDRTAAASCLVELHTILAVITIADIRLVDLHLRHGVLGFAEYLPSVSSRNC